jgi:hypothetical protein
MPGGADMTMSTPVEAENALGGGVTISLAQDIHGKSLSNVMLAIELPERN